MSGFGFKFSSVWCRVCNLGFRFSGFGFRVSGFGFRVSGVGFRAEHLEVDAVELIKASPRRWPLSSESGTYKTVKARFRPWLSGESPETA